MENLDLLEKLGKIAGIAGIAVGALVLIFGGIIQKNIFPGMTKEQGFRVIRMMIISASMLALIGIVAWVYTSFQSGQREKEASLISKSIIGQVLDINGMGIPNVKASIAQMPEVVDKADQDGNFVLRLEGVGKKYLDIVFDHPQYQTARKKITIDFNEEGDEMRMGSVNLIGAETEKLPETSGGGDNNRPQNNSNTSNGNNPNQDQTTVGSTNINLYYNDEGTGCNLDITITIGGLTYTPQSNPVQLLNVRKGFQQYVVSGTAYCSGGQCQVTGQGQLKIVDNGQYYMVFDPAITCIATILNEEDYNELMDVFY